MGKTAHGERSRNQHPSCPVEAARFAGCDRLIESDGNAAGSVDRKIFPAGFHVAVGRQWRPVSVEVGAGLDQDVGGGRFERKRALEVDFEHAAVLVNHPLQSRFGGGAPRVGLELEFLVVGEAVAIGILAAAGDRGVGRLFREVGRVPHRAAGEDADGGLGGERAVEGERVGGVRGGRDVEVAGTIDGGGHHVADALVDDKRCGRGDVPFEGRGGALNNRWPHGAEQADFGRAGHAGGLAGSGFG